MAQVQRLRRAKNFSIAAINWIDYEMDETFSRGNEPLEKEAIRKTFILGHNETKQQQLSPN